MAFQTLTLPQIKPSAGNPRKFFDDATIRELAASIKSDGLLQNLVVFKPDGKGKTYNIIAGERRFRAISLLVKQGQLPKDFAIPVEIKENLTAEESLRISTVENVQRENLTPMEEAEALGALVGQGEKADNICAQTGLSLATIRRRLILLGLSDSVKKALAEKKVTLAQAEALTLGTHQQQDEMLDDLDRGFASDPQDIRENLIGDLPTVAMAIFPLDNYTGELTRDLLSTDETTYFNDVEQFSDLQKQAAENLVKEYAESCEWAVLETGYHFNLWAYESADEGQPSGVVVFLSSSGHVTVHTGLVKREVDTATTSALREKRKAFYPASLCQYMRMHKSLALQAALLDNARTLKQLVVCKRLASFHAHECHRYFGQQGSQPVAMSLINQEIEAMLPVVGLGADDGGASPSFESFLGFDEAAAYDAVKNLTDQQLENLLLLLEALSFGQTSIDRLDTDPESLFNKVATDLAVDMRRYWYPEEAFFQRRDRSQLQQIINETGASARFGSASGYKKGELVRSLANYFQRARIVKQPSDAEKQAAAWLPGAMLFPAIDPSEVPGTTKEDEMDDFASEQ